MKKANILIVFCVFGLLISIFGMVPGSTEYVEHTLENDAIFFSNGRGTAEDPYLIEDIGDLQDMGSDLSANYQLVDDIDAGETSGWEGGFEPVGSGSDPFTGTFDGNGYKITGMYIDRPDDDYVGLFGATGTGSTVIDVEMVDVDVNGNDDDGEEDDEVGTGTLIGYNKGDLKYTHAEGDVHGGYNVGGLVSLNEGTIESSSASVDVFSEEDTYIAGGLVGRNDGTILNSLSTGHVRSAPWDPIFPPITLSTAGGFVGENNGLIENSYAMGYTEGIGMAVGGFAAHHQDGTIKNSYSTGIVDSEDEDYVGGFAGILGEQPGGYLNEDVIFQEEILSVDPEINDSFWDIDASDMEEGVGSVEDGDDSGLTGKDTDEMKNKETFTDVGWDFEDIWTMEEAENEGYPIFRWQIEEGSDLYRLTVDIDGEGEVEVDPEEEEYAGGAEVELTALPEDGWTFVEWTGDNEGTNEEITITMDEDKEVTASFEELEEYELAVNIEGEGVVKVGGEEIDDGWSGYHYVGSTVELRSISEDGWYFSRWSGDHEDMDREIMITMDEDKEITAHFEEASEDENILTIEVEGEGTTEPEPGDHLYDEGVEITIEAIPEKSSIFKEWSGDHESTDEEISFVIDGDKTVRAHFTELHELTVEESQGSGEVLVDGDIIETWPYVEEFEEDESVVLEASPAEDWVFDRWDLNDEIEDDLEITVIMDEDKVISAYFLKVYELTTFVEGEGTIEVHPEGEKYGEFTEVYLEAVAEKGWTFVEWTGDLEGTEENITIEMDSDKEITAVFEERDERYYDIELNIDGEGNVDIVPDKDEYEEGEEVTLTAEPREGWKFVSWSGDVPMDLEEDSEITITVSENMDIAADFEEDDDEDESIIGSNIGIISILSLLIVVSVITAILLMKKKKKRDEQTSSKSKRFLLEVGKNLGFGIGMFGTLGISLVILASLMDMADEMIIMLLFVTLLLTPLLSLFIGVFQGKASSNPIRAAVSSGLTGVLGFFVILFAIFAVVMINFENGNGGDDMMGAELMLAFGLASLIAGGGGGCLGHYFYCEMSMDVSEDTTQERIDESLEKREKERVDSAQGHLSSSKIQGSEEIQSTSCPDCGQDLDYLHEYERWYCWGCEEYK